MELSTLIGKQILSPNGEILGYVKNAYLTQGLKKISSLVCIDGEEEEFYLSARALVSIGDVIIAGKSRLQAPTGSPCPMGAAVYSSRGDYLGSVGDLLLGDSDPVFIVVKDGIRTSYAAECVFCGETVIIYPDKRAKNAATRTRTVKTRSASAPVKQPPKAKPVQVEPLQIAEPTAAATPETNETEYRCNLLGRIVKKSLYDCYGLPIAIAGERITPATVSAARKNNLLLRLTVNTLTNLY